MVNLLANFLRFFREEKVISNVFNSHSQKRILISYTIFPFVSKSVSHTNFQESRIIAEIFNKFGYCVDIVHYTNQRRLDYSKYDLLFGFGEPFENSFQSRKKIKRIYYATGAHVCHQNYAEIKRVTEVNRKMGSDLLPKRIVPWNWSMSTSMSDAMIIIGNEWTKSTYEKYCTIPVYTINATALINKKTVGIKRDIESTKKNFLWFGGSGLVHKGLDLCLEYFSLRNNLTLHICGPSEKDFFTVFSDKIDTENIHFHDVIDVQNDKFVDIIGNCLFTIMPTCSEGQSTALLTSMGAGLIPISNRYSGVDIEKCGFLIESLDVETIERTIDHALLQSNETLVSLSAHAQQYIFENHQIDNFEENFRMIIEEIID